MAKKSSLLLGTALALALGAPAVLANDNAAYIDQEGNGNTALIAQGTGSENAVGLATDAALQDGDNNTLDIFQGGSENEVGTLGTGLLQKGSGQRTETSSANPSTLRRYQFIDIDQTSSGNVIGEITQTDGGNNQKGNNTLTVLQETGNGNGIGSINQFMKSGKVGQIATITQSGMGNRIERIVQQSTSETGSRANILTLAFTGNRNGATVDGLAGTLSGAAAMTGVASGTFSQLGNGNTVALDVIGSDNQFGIVQSGQLNAIGPLTVTGTFNEIGIVQNEIYSTADGLGANIVNPGVITGSFNAIGIAQTGANTLTMNVIGDDNAFTVEQSGTNTATLDITGNRNGQFGLSSFGVGPALSVTGPDSLSLDPGTIHQNGTGNTVSLTIKGAADVANSGDDNLFAFYQHGTGNAITGTQDGHANEVAISQIGTGHVTIFTQVGAFNVLGVSQ